MNIKKLSCKRYCVGFITSVAVSLILKIVVADFLNKHLVIKSLIKLFIVSTLEFSFVLLSYYQDFYRSKLNHSLFEPIKLWIRCKKTFGNRLKLIRSKSILKNCFHESDLKLCSNLNKISGASVDVVFFC